MLSASRFPPVWVPIVQSLESPVYSRLVFYPLCVSLFRLGHLQIPRDLPCSPSWSRAVMDSRLHASQSYA